MTARVESLLEHGRGLLRRERSALRAGRLRELAEIADEKAAFVATLEAEIAGLTATPPIRAAFEALIADARENERLLRAAREGVGAARRHLEALDAVRRGVVAYDRDGSAILSRGDAVRRSSRA